MNKNITENPLKGKTAWKKLHQENDSDIDYSPSEHQRVLI